MRVHTDTVMSFSDGPGLDIFLNIWHNHDRSKPALQADNAKEHSEHENSRSFGFLSVCLVQKQAV